MEQKHKIEDLYQMQSLSLESKISMTMQRIKGWYDSFDGNVYVSFSGGKDSTVLADIVLNRCCYKDVPLVYCDTGLEYPEIRDFVKNYEIVGHCVEWIKPKMNFRQIIEKYGYPFISKQQSEFIHEVRHSKSEKLINKRLNKDGNSHPMSVISKKYRFLLDADFELSDLCCDYMKKKPFIDYEKRTGRKGIVGVMATESVQRTTNWLKFGCNAFNTNRPISSPMAFWTEQDVLLYILKYQLPICSVYGNIVEDVDDTEEVQGQMTFSDMKGYEDFELFDAKKPTLKTTGCDRTGCMFCGYGCQIPNSPNANKFVNMKQTHPKQYEYIMKPWDEGGLDYKRIIDYMNEHGNLGIRY